MFAVAVEEAAVAFDGEVPVDCDAAGAFEGCKAAVLVRAAPSADGRVVSEEETPFATPVGALPELPLLVLSLMRISSVSILSNLRFFPEQSPSRTGGSEPDWRSGASRTGGTWGWHL